MPLNVFFLVEKKHCHNFVVSSFVLFANARKMFVVNAACSDVAEILFESLVKHVFLSFLVSLAFKLLRGVHKC